MGMSVKIIVDDMPLYFKADEVEVLADNCHISAHDGKVIITE